ncbi:MAG: tRNA lysidine(34) synthetase TilS [Desulfamplus sp.]|nr:tRNA lysidine(34) synthetase TilS [Desulfamplus sp.]
MSRLPFIKDICNVMEGHAMILPHDHILVALSGGPDSVAMLGVFLHIRQMLDLKLGIAHINHCLRGDEADGDEAFVRELAFIHKLPCHISRTDVPALAKSRGLSFEEAARQVRYAFYGNLSRDYGYCRIALGHNSDDNAEQVLMNLLRGTGTKGLAGIPPTRLLKMDNLKGPTIIRPLIQTSRKEIMDWLEQQGQPFMVDSSNSDTSYLRNRVRLHLIPYLQREYNPSVSEALNQLSRILIDEESWMEGEAEKLFKRHATLTTSGGDVIQVSFPRSVFATMLTALSRRLVRRAILAVKGDLKRVAMVHVEAILKLIPAPTGGTSLDLPGRIRMTRDIHRVYFRKESVPLRQLNSPVS